MYEPSFKTLAQLMRLPNVFSAFADIALAGCAIGLYQTTSSIGMWVLLAICSGCLYCGGMVFNDLFDRHDDAKTQPFRPIPSGRITPRTTAMLGGFLFSLAIVCATIVTLVTKGEIAFDLQSPLAVCIALIVAILAYDASLKHAMIGPISMGSCRFLNIMMGLSVADAELLSPINLHLAATTGLYIVGVTWFARREESISTRWQLYSAALIMLIACGLALTLPTHQPLGSTLTVFPYLVVAFIILIGSKVQPALANLGPKAVQAAIKRMIFGLVFLDAVLASVFVGYPGLLIATLLVPAILLGKRIYST